MHHELVSNIEASFDKLTKANFIREVQFSHGWLTQYQSKSKMDRFRYAQSFKIKIKLLPRSICQCPTPTYSGRLYSLWGLDVHGQVFGCNQIKIHSKDKEMIAFYSLKGVFCYNVIHFALRKIQELYTKRMKTVYIFEEMFGNNDECYVDDLVVQTWQIWTTQNNLKWCLTNSGAIN